jgi:hypothetical protein
MIDRSFCLLTEESSIVYSEINFNFIFGRAYGLFIFDFLHEAL